MFAGNPRQPHRSSQASLLLPSSLDYGAQPYLHIHRFQHYTPPDRGDPRTTKCRPTLMLRQIKCANGQCSDESKCFVIPTPGQTGDNSPTAMNEMTRMSVFSYSQPRYLHQPPLQRPVCSDNDNNGQPYTFPDDYSTMQNYCVRAFQATCAEILIFPANGNGNP